MRTHPDCFPCFLRQSLIALWLGTDDESLQEIVLKSVLEYIQYADSSKPPAYVTYFIHRKIRQMLEKDPFKEIKSKYNKIALEMYPHGRK
jgi:damage-control phosphatase, subfamily I